MALYTGRILVRRGNEIDYSPDKFMPGEWALSTDKKIVRICVAAGVCIRMATYEAFEEDMVKIEEILEECQSIQEAVIRINTEVSQNADAVAEYTAQAKTYMESANASATNAKASEEASKLSETNSKSSETNAKLSEEHAQAVFESLPEDYGTLSKEFYEVAIKQKASGEDIHVNDSSNAKVREFALFGKAKQQTTSGKNLLPYPYANVNTTKNGITVTDNDGAITVNGTATSDSDFVLKSKNNMNLDDGVSYILSGCPSGGNASTFLLQYWNSVNGSKKDVGNGIEFTHNNSASDWNIAILVKSGTTVNNLVFKPMIRLASITDDTYEPYTGGQPSPSPSYEQPVEVKNGDVVVKSCGKNLLKNTSVGLVKNGINFVINEDKSIIVNGTATDTCDFYVNGSWHNTENILPIYEGKIISSGTKSNLIQQYLIRNSTSVKGDLNGSDIRYSLNGGLTAVMYRINKDVTINNYTIYPMIRLASIENDIYEPYKETTATIPVTDFAGIPVSSGGNYTDSNGQQWICDEIVKYADGSGEYVQRVGKTEFKNAEWRMNYANNFYTPLDNLKYLKGSFGLCTNLQSKSTNEIDNIHVNTNGVIRVNITSDNVDTTKTLMENSIFYGILAEPIRTPLTAEEIAEIEKLQTFYPITNISNDADCGMSVTYLCDSKNYIDSKIAELATAMVNNI